MPKIRFEFLATWGEYAAKKKNGRNFPYEILLSCTENYSCKTWYIKKSRTYWYEFSYWKFGMRMVIATKTEWNLGIGPPVCVVGHGCPVKKMSWEQRKVARATDWTIFCTTMRRTALCEGPRSELTSQPSRLHRGRRTNCVGTIIIRRISILTLYWYWAPAIICTGVASLQYYTLQIVVG